MSVATAPQLLTAEDYALLPDKGQPTELVRGKVHPVNMPRPRHGQICARVVRIIGNFVDEHNLGHILSNDSGVVTERGPDTVRGADVAFYSYNRVPPGPLPQQYLAAVPELVFEVRSLTDRWRGVLAKVAEYLNAGVSVVCVLDDPTDTIHVYTDDAAARVLTGDQPLTLPGVLPDFQVEAKRFFT